jgi:GDP-L-fucose synthase
MEGFSNIDLINKKVVVTGGVGFLGRHVVNTLKSRGCRDIIIPRKSQYNLIRESDVGKLFRDTRPEVVIHLAAVLDGMGGQ